MFLSHEQLQDRGINLSERQLRRLEAEGKFPQRIHLSTYRVAWDADEIERWCQARRDAREPVMSCWVCGAPATRVMAGKQCCSRHTQYGAHPSDPPPDPCAVCEAPSNRRESGLPFCRAHNSYDLPPRAA